MRGRDGADGRGHGNDGGGDNGRLCRAVGDGGRTARDGDLLRRVDGGRGQRLTGGTGSLVAKLTAVMVVSIVVVCLGGGGQGGHEGDSKFGKHFSLSSGQISEPSLRNEQIEKVAALRSIVCFVRWGSMEIPVY